MRDRRLIAGGTDLSLMAIWKALRDLIEFLMLSFLLDLSLSESSSL